MKKEEDSDDGYAGANNTTMSSCDYSMSQFKDDPLSEIKDEDSEEDTPLVMSHKMTIIKFSDLNLSTHTWLMLFTKQGLLIV